MTVSPIHLKACNITSRHSGDVGFICIRNLDANDVLAIDLNRHLEVTNEPNIVS